MLDTPSMDDTLQHVHMLPPDNALREKWEAELQEMAKKPLERIRWCLESIKVMAKHAVMRAVMGDWPVHEGQVKD